MRGARFISGVTACIIYAVLTCQALGEGDLSAVKPIGYRELKKPENGQPPIVDTNGFLNGKDAVATLGRFISSQGIRAYAVIVGQMKVEEGWVDEVEADENVQKDLIVRYTTSLAHRWNCTGDCVLFVLSVKDRQLKLRCDEMSNNAIDSIVESIRSMLREREYTEAVQHVITQSRRFLKGAAQDWNVISFITVALLFSVSAVILIRRYPTVWLGLLVLYLVTSHWFILLVTLGATAAEGYRLQAQPTLNLQHDPWDRYV
ncbi:hypothetical protein DIPPA_55017 [Diplonema papillatum]|nr:hypothetical protein DIPPA_55017 [Diplonema papillatum]